MKILATFSVSLMLFAALLGMPERLVAQEEDPLADFTAPADYATWDFINVARFSTITTRGQLAESTLSIGYETRPDAFSELSKGFYYQNQIPLTVGTEQSQSISRRLGNTTTFYVLPESHSSETEWLVRVSHVIIDGSSDTLFSDYLQSGEVGYVSALEESIITVEIIQGDSPAAYPRQVWLTIVPDLEMLGYITSAMNGLPLSLRR